MTEFDNSAETTSPAIRRRALMKGAAWAAPIVSITVAAPAVAASSDAATLEFTQPSYVGAACGVLSGVQVRRTTDGTAPAAGVSITVTLADGFTFADGTTIFTDVTDAEGLVTLPDINVPSAGGTSAFDAVSDALTAAAPVTAPPIGVHRWYGMNDGLTPAIDTYVDVPYSANSLEGGGRFWLDGTTLYDATGAVIATDVNSPKADFEHFGTGYVHWVTWTASNGSAHRYYITFSGATSGVELYPSVPSGAIPVSGSAKFWYLDGTIYDESGGALATDVSSYVADIEMTTSGYVDYLAWMGTDGVARTLYWTSTTETGTADHPGVPVGAAPLDAAGKYWLSNGTIYDDSGAVIGSNVVEPIAADFERWGTGHQYSVAWTDASGSAHRHYIHHTGATETYTYPDVPTGATPLGSSGEYWFLGETIYRNNGVVIAEGVANPTGDFEFNGEGTWGTWIAWNDVNNCR